MEAFEINSIEMELIYQHLRLQARKLTFNKEDAEDLASDAFTKGLEKINSFRPPEGDDDKQLRALKGWFNRIMKNLNIDKIKSADNQRVDRSFEIDDDLTRSATEKPETLAMRDDLQSKLFSTCRELLSPREFEILLLNMEGYKYREIADELGITTNSVGAKVSNAKLKLAEKLEIFDEFHK